MVSNIIELAFHLAGKQGNFSYGVGSDVLEVLSSSLWQKKGWPGGGGRSQE